MAIIEVSNLSKHYGNVHAVKNISFKVKENAFFALLGPNGAGKSTTIEILSTLLGKDQGTIKINGYELDTDDDAIRKHLGVVFQYNTLDKDLTVMENLELRAALYKMTKAEYLKRVETLDRLIQFQSFANQRIRHLSGGQRRKADIARALLHSPRILMLDEPTTGLDPKSRKGLWELILKLKEATKMTILLTTHYMEEVLDADHVIILHEGVIRAEDSAENLRIQYAKDTLKIVPKATLKDLLKRDKIPFRLVNQTMHIDLKNPFQGIEIVKTYKDAIETFEIVKASMDDVFLNITGERLEETL